MMEASVASRATKTHVTTRALVLTWAALLGLTALTVAMASVNLGRLAIVAVLAIAGLKSSLVAAFFMHLRYEKTRLYLGFLLISVAVLAIFLGLTLTDLLAR
jgi:cytochrome c oxidase subunit 4